LSGTGAPQEPLSEIEGSLDDFALVFKDLVRVEFKSLKFRMVSNQKPEFNAELPRELEKRFAFLGHLEFLNKLSQKLPGFGAGGPVIKLSPDGISAGVSMATPNVSLGALSLQNLALSAQLNLFFAKATELRFALSSREHPFLVSYSLLGGGGFFALTVSANKGQAALEAAIEFGGVLALDLFIARGEVQAMVGIYFSLRGNESYLEGYVRLYGCLNVLEIVVISVEFYLKLAYSEGKATGSARLTVTVRVLMFSKSVTLEVKRSFSTNESAGLIASAPSFRDFSKWVRPEHWTKYCNSFA
jgi:hypothetical protein